MTAPQGVGVRGDFTREVLYKVGLKGCGGVGLMGEGQRSHLGKEACAGNTTPAPKTTVNPR